MFVDLIVLHLGALHPFEKVLTFTLAFGPFVLLGVVIAVRRHQDAAAAEGEQPQAEVSSGPATADRPEPPADRP